MSAEEMLPHVYKMYHTQGCIKSTTVALEGINDS